jgi:hypothetical protein
MERTCMFWGDAVTGRVPPPPCAQLLGVHKGRSVAFLEGTLRAQGGELIATASATTRIVPFEEPSPGG